jgi:hypothetical protein
MIFNQDISKHIQFPNLSSLQPNFISTEIKNKFIMNFLKLITKNINSNFFIINSTIGYCHFYYNMKFRNLIFLKILCYFHLNQNYCNKIIIYLNCW